DRYSGEFWLRDKCWPNVFYYLTVPVYEGAASAGYLAERPKIQQKFVQMLESGAPHSSTAIAYSASYFALVWLAWNSIVMSAFFVVAPIKSPVGDKVLRLPGEDAHLYLSLSSIGLLAWVPFRMSAIYYKDVYFCGVLADCPSGLSRYLDSIE